MPAKIILKPGREKSVIRHHPWIFSGAIQKIDSEISPGEIVDVYSADNQFLARGYANPNSQILVRLLTWGKKEKIDKQFWCHRLNQAITLRKNQFSPPFRLVYAESDGLPGLIIDNYGEWLVLQAFTAGIERVKPTLVSILFELIQVKGIYERSEGEMRIREGLKESTGILEGEEPPDKIEITESGWGEIPIRFLVDIKKGQKTGFYLDQKENRRKVAAYCKGKQVLNVFSYTGGFSLQALVGKANRVINIESSTEAITLAQQNTILNGFPVHPDDYLCGDAFHLLRVLRDKGEKFDVIILDPPRLAPSRAHLPKATRAYKDLNLISLQLIRPGGILATFSCSGLVSPELFQKIVFAASLDAQRAVQIIEKLSQSPDHPILLTFPESEYLKGLLCRVW